MLGVDSVPTIEDTMTEDRLTEVEEAVLKAIREQDSPRVLDLLQSLRGQFSTADMKLALAELLHQGSVELTSDRTLRAAA
jgi:hypothetical protein